MKKISILLFIFLSVSTVFSQGWEKTYGGQELDHGNCVKQTTDGGYIVVGSTKSFGIVDKSIGTVNRDIYLIKTNNNGDTLWTRTYGGTEREDGYYVQQTTDGGYIITGRTESFGMGDEDIYLIKTDNIGDTLWTKTFGGNEADLGYSVQQTTDGGYIITGSTRFGGHFHVYLIKTDSAGDSLWTKTYNGIVSSHGTSVDQTIDGGYIITGENLTLNNSNDVFLIKTNNVGDTLWTKTYGGNDADRGLSVQQTSDSGYIVSGYKHSANNLNSYVYLIKTDNAGDTLWTKTYGGEGFSMGTYVQQTIDGGYIIAGENKLVQYPFLSDVYLIKTNSTGDTLWTKTYGGENRDWGCSVQQTTDGGYIITGVSSSFGNYEDVYLIKIDSSGNLSFITEIPSNPNRKLIKIVDFLGREIVKPNKNTPYIEIYNDGSAIKKMILE